MRVVRTGGNAERQVAEVTGQAVDLSDSGLSIETIRTAISGDGDIPVSVDCPNPSRWWERLAVPTDDTPPLDRIVAAAQSRGIRVPEERALASAEQELATLATERVDPVETRRRLAAAGENVAALREEVAAARGRLQALRENDDKDTETDTQPAQASLADAAEKLSEAETEQLAAEQAHDAAERQARRARSIRERRLRLQDRVANRRRNTRRTLVTSVADAFADAIPEVPGEATLSTDPLSVEGDGVTAALAAIWVADLRAPVVDATGRFDSAAAAATVLDASVVRC